MGTMETAALPQLLLASQKPNPPPLLLQLRWKNVPSTSPSVPRTILFRCQLWPHWPPARMPVRLTGIRLVAALAAASRDPSEAGRPEVGAQRRDVVPLKDGAAVDPEIGARRPQA